MFKNFLTALLEKIVSFLSSNQDFFELNEAKRNEKMAELKVPNSFKVYLASVSSEDFMEDIKLILRYTQSPKKTAVKDNAFFKSFVGFLSLELSKKIDYLSGDFYLMTAEDRKEAIGKLIKSDSLLAQTLKAILENFTYQQILGEIYELSSKVTEVPYIVVQSPREVNIELKREIREKISEEHPLSIPVFQINKKLIGGIRVFKNGQSVDHSWLQRVLQFTSLTSS